MSSKSTILLTNDFDEHWFDDCSEPLNRSGQNAITLEFDKANIRIDMNDDDALVITIINPDSEIYQVFKNFKI